MITGSGLPTKPSRFETKPFTSGPLSSILSHHPPCSTWPLGNQQCFGGLTMPAFAALRCWSAHKSQSGASMSTRSSILKRGFRNRSFDVLRIQIDYFDYPYPARELLDRFRDPKCLKPAGLSSRSTSGSLPTGVRAQGASGGPSRLTPNRRRRSGGSKSSFPIACGCWKV